MVTLEGFMLRLRYLAVLGLAGCSPVKDTSNVPDAPIDSTDMRPAMVESSNPPNMGTKVSVLQPISVFFDEGLDPASVNAATIKVGYDESILPPLMPFFNYTINHGPMPAGLTPIEGTVSYDAAARKVSFDPVAPLPYGVELILSYAVKDKAGLEATGTISFTTYVNAQTRNFFYNSVGAPSSWIILPTDMTGRNSKRTGASSQGPNGIWFDSDDPRNQHYEFKQNVDGRMTEERQMSSGTDGLYDTPDDATNACVTYKYATNKSVTERMITTTVGPDGMFCTADDVPLYLWSYQYMASTLTGYIWFTSAGTDAMWRTPDDRCSVIWEYQYDAAGNKTREISRGCGPDALPRTVDDTINYYYDYEYDAKGRLTKTVLKTAGPDAMFFTPDDLINSPYDRYTRNGDGQVTELIRSFNAGPDAMWGTGDDAGVRTTTTYNAQKLIDEVTNFGAGPDNMIGNADDVINNYSKTTYDMLGNRIDQKLYNGGIDGVFKNADDRVIQDNDFDASR
jgi:hypothetical protein